MCVMSSRLMTAPFSCAYLIFGRAGVSFDENMMSSPVMPAFSERMSSGRLEQSAPMPSLARIFRTYGIRACLDREEFAEIREARKRLEEAARVLADRLFVIDIKRCGIPFRELCKPVFGKGKIFFRHSSLLWFRIYKRPPVRKGPKRVRFSGGTVPNRNIRRRDCAARNCRVQVRLFDPFDGFSLGDAVPRFAQARNTGVSLVTGGSLPFSVER